MDQNNADSCQPRYAAPMTATRVPVVNPYLKTKKVEPDKLKHSTTTPMTGFLLSSVIHPKPVPGDVRQPVATESGWINERQHGGESSVLPIETKGPTALYPEPQSLPVALEDKTPHHVHVGENLAIQYRLPSRTVSFQSAEHLSVMELHSHRHYYQDRSVRIAGIVLHRHVVESDASICFVLGDAVEAARPKGRHLNHRIPNTPQQSGPGGGGAAVGGGVTVEPKIGTTPSSAKQAIRTLGPAKTPLNRLTNLQDKTPHSTLSSKRKLIHVPRGSGTNSLLSRCSKRRLSFSSPTESALNCLISKPTMLVIVNPLQHPHAADCGVGDSLMVIGEVVLHNVNNTLAQPFVSLYRKKLERMADDDDMEDDDNHHGGSTTTTAGRSSPTIHYIAPRILRNVNGTDLRLQYEVLLKRREHVQRLSYDSNHPGCGPPQEHRHNNNNNSMTLTPSHQFYDPETQPPETQQVL